MELLPVVIKGTSMNPVENPVRRSIQRTADVYMRIVAHFPQLDPPYDPISHDQRPYKLTLQVQAAIGYGFHLEEAGSAFISSPVLRILKPWRRSALVGSC